MSIDTQDSGELYLYSSEEGPQILLAKSIHSLSRANPQKIEPHPLSQGEDPAHAGGPAKSANLGTLTGVYLPCIQNILGVILFIRMTWLVGTAGIICGFCIVLLCCCVTMLTSISMSAIATNGVVPTGGSYFMISRSLGSEFGGAVGILFYIGTTFAAAMYIVGAIEILIIYMAPQLSLFGDTNVPANMNNNYRLYGTLLLTLIGSIVFAGVRFVNKFAAIALVCVLGSIGCIYAGIFLNWSGNRDMEFCILGERLLKGEGTGNCSKDEGSPIFTAFCKAHGNGWECDPYFLQHNVSKLQGTRGLGSVVFSDNIWPAFMSVNQIVSRSLDPEHANPNFLHINGTAVRSSFSYVLVDMSTQFSTLVGIFFPSVTGIMAGSNRSGDLADAQKSIPLGTICAVLTTSFIYLSSVLLFGSCFDNLLMRDKFGQSIGGHLAIANIAWPNEWTILIGSFSAALGAGMQSLTGAPRLLQAIAKDRIIPVLEPFGVSSGRGEPTRALLFTLCICEFGVLLGNVDVLAPLLSMFFLMCYGFVNLACALQSLLKTPNWRPRFRYYHWSLSLLGLALCIGVMFMASWIYALLAIGIATCIYKYIEYNGAKKEWGDGIRGISLSAARFALLKLENVPPHTKNWRPQILVLLNLSSTSDLKEKRMISFVSQLKAGKGLVIAGSVLESEAGSYTVEQGRRTLKHWMELEKVKGFRQVLQCDDVSVGISILTQTAGIGGLKPNTVVLGWPDSKAFDKISAFMTAVRTACAAGMALIVPKGLDNFPTGKDRISGYIDVWWMVQDGGIATLLPFLLKQHPTWKSCSLRIFTVAHESRLVKEMEKDLSSFLYAARIQAKTQVVTLPTNDASLYAQEKMRLTKQRNKLLGEINVTGKRRASIADNFEMLNGGILKKNLVMNVDEALLKMDTAVKLNELIYLHSHDAKLVLINAPPVPANHASDATYLELIELLTAGIERSLLLRSGGREVITIYS